MRGKDRKGEAPPRQATRQQFVTLRWPLPHAGWGRRRGGTAASVPHPYSYTETHAFSRLVASLSTLPVLSASDVASLDLLVMQPFPDWPFLEAPQSHHSGSFEKIVNGRQVIANATRNFEGEA